MGEVEVEDRPRGIDGERRDGRPPARPPAERWEVAIAWIATLVVAAPLLIGIASWIGRSWLPVQDLAVLDLRVRDVGTADTPLLGPYSRYIWSHPGPTLFWLLGIPSLLTGHAAWGTLVGGMGLQLWAVGWIARTSWRAGRLPLLLTMLAVVALSYGATGTWLVLEPWNPHIAFPWFILFVLLSWRLSLGEVRQLPGWAFVATFLVQTHVGYAPLVAVAAAYLVGALLVDRSRGTPWALPRRSWIATAVILAVLWVPVLVEEVTGDPGNLTLLWRFFTGAGANRPTAGLGVGAGLFATEFRPLPPWLGGSDVVDQFTGTVAPSPSRWLLVPVVLLAAGYVATRLSGRRPDRRWVELVALLAATGVLALSRITDELTPYLFLWRIPLAVLCVAASGWALAGWLAGRVGTARGAQDRGRLVAAGEVVLGVAILAAALPLAAKVATHGDTVFSFEGEARSLLDQLPPPGSLTEPVIVRFDGTTLDGLHGAVVDAYDRAGAPVRVDPELGFQFGDHRVAAPAEVGTVWMVVEDGRLVSDFTQRPGAQVLARQEPLGPDKEAELVALQTELTAQLGAAGRPDLVPSLDSPLLAFQVDGIAGVDQAAAARLGDLNAEREATERCRCAVIAFPTDQAPPLPPRPG
ncbi:MAG: hypothetical protein U0Q07_19535 [Acidimicrobiales bacterium]